MCCHGWRVWLVRVASPSATHWARRNRPLINVNGILFLFPSLCLLFFNSFYAVFLSRSCPRATLLSFAPRRRSYGRLMKVSHWDQHDLFIPRRPGKQTTKQLTEVWRGGERRNASIERRSAHNEGKGCLLAKCWRRDGGESACATLFLFFWSEVILLPPRRRRPDIEFQLADWQ